jgi:TonB family protein
MRLLLAALVMAGSPLLWGDWLPVSFEGPVYPPLATQAQISGTVVLRVHLDVRGHVTSSDSASGHPILARCAQDNIRTWSFERSSGDAQSGTASTIEFTYAFKLEGQAQAQPRTRVRFERPYLLTVTAAPQLWTPTQTSR